MLKNKTILLCVSASIAIYKSLDLIRLFIRNGANVKVLMTESSKKFITPLTFECISQNEVLHEKSESWKNNYNHIKFTTDCDAVVFAPASANSINKLSLGIADNLLIQTLIANTKPLFIAPAMNTNMYNHFSTQNALKILKNQNIEIIEPQNKMLACNIQGKGALADIETIFYATCKMILKDDFWNGKKVIVTGGGTKENIDDVRFIGNFSSGKMAKNLALALYLKGADVTLLSSVLFDKMPYKITPFTNAKSLQEELKKLAFCHEYLFMAAAVGDFRCINQSSGKLKKEDLGDKWSLELTQNVDIIASINEIKKIGFKAEFDKQNALNNAQKALKSKNLDAICLNILGDEVNFNSDQSKMTFITQNDKIDIKLNDKLNVAFEILDQIKKQKI